MKPVPIVATESDVLRAVPGRSDLEAVSNWPRGLSPPPRPTCLAADPHRPGRFWLGTRRHGVLRSDDYGQVWAATAVKVGHVTSITGSPTRRGLVWAGTEPSVLWRSDDGGSNWHQTEDLETLGSSSTWAFPPRPDTHHVRWIAPHPADSLRLWLAIEAGALISTYDGGASWEDRVPGGPYDTHELAVHHERPDVLRVAAGDGCYESRDGGQLWTSPSDGLDVGYFRSVAIDPGDPDIVLMSGASGPRTTYVAGRSDGRLFRREGAGPWRRVTHGWPDPPATIAPLLAAGFAPGELWAANERGLHRTVDSGLRWEMVAVFAAPPSHLRGLAIASEVEAP